MYKTLLEYLPPLLMETSPIRELKKDEVVYRRGDAATHLFVVERGRLRLSSLDTEGHPVPLYVVRQGECVSEAALFSDVYCGDLTAEVRSRVRCVPKHRMLEALDRDPRFSGRYMMEMARRFNSLRVRLELRNLKSARERVLQYLITSAPVGGNTLLIECPLKSIADDLGLTPESFYRTLAGLAAEGLVTRTRKTLTLHQYLPRCSAFSPAGPVTGGNP